jgi:hypothetical protein
MFANPDYDSVLKAVSAWPAEQRIAFANAILETVRHDANKTGARRQTLQRALGLGRRDAQPPNDEEVARWLDKHWASRY